MNREPLLTAAGITAAITALIGLLVAFGVTVTEGQTAAILGVVAILGPIVVALVARAKVTPTADPKDDSGNPLTPGV